MSITRGALRAVAVSGVERGCGRLLRRGLLRGGRGVGVAVGRLLALRLVEELAASPAKCLERQVDAREGAVLGGRVGQELGVLLSRDLRGDDRRALGGLAGTVLLRLGREERVERGLEEHAAGVTLVEVEDLDAGVSPPVDLELGRDLHLRRTPLREGVVATLLLLVPCRGEGLGALSDDVRGVVHDNLLSSPCRGNRVLLLVGDLVTSGPGGRSATMITL